MAGLATALAANFSTTVNVVDPATFGLTSLTGINVQNDRARLQGMINELLGRVGSVSQAFVAAGDQYGPPGTRFLFDARYPEHDLYAQDTWKIRPNLTLDYGLRWEARLTPRGGGDEVILRPDRPLRVGEQPRNDAKWTPGDLFDSDYNNFAPTIGLAWDPFGTGKTSVRANYRLAYDRMNTFVLSSTIYQSAPGATLGVINQAFGQNGGRLRDGLPTVSPPAGATPITLRQPTAFGVGTSSITLTDPDMRTPKTNQWGLSIQRDIGLNTVFELNYIGRRGVGLYGGYDANQVNVFAGDPRFNQTFLEAFNTLRAALPATGSALPASFSSPLLNQLMQFDSRRGATESGAQAFARLFEADIRLGSAAGVASAIAGRLQGGSPVHVLGGFSPFFFQPFPQFGIVNLLDSNDISTYHAFEAQIKRRFERGVSYQISYTWAKSLDTRSFDPAFTTVSRANNQSGSSTPFDLRNRRLNYARSDFDRRHSLQALFVYELPFGRGKTWLNGLNSAVDQVIGGWEMAGTVVLQSGRPFTVYSGANTLSNSIQSYANCNGCTPDMGKALFEQANGTVFFFDPNSRGASFNSATNTRGLFSIPAPGALGNTGRNFFTGPPVFQLDMLLAKRVRIIEGHSLQFRVEAQNLTNTPSFGFPTATITSAIFGRIRDSVVSNARRVQLAVKYNF